MSKYKSFLEEAYNHPALKYIYKEIKEIKNIRILELGVREGLSTCLFLKACDDNDGKMISIDIDNYSHLHQNNKWNFICTRDDNFEKIDKEILKIGDLDVIYIDSFHEPNHVKKIFYHYYSFLKEGGFIFVDDISWLPYAKSTKRTNSGNYEANIKTFEKLLEIKLSNFDRFKIEFSFESSGTAKIIKNNSLELNEPKKVEKIFSLKSLILNVYKKFF